MEFYATKAGKDFFEFQLPSLIQVLKDMTETLKERQVPVMLSTEAEDGFLKELYYGNTEIGVNSKEGYSDEKLEEIVAIQEELKGQLTKRQWEIFETYSSKMSSYASEESCRMFQHGFRLAVKLIMAGLSETERTE